MIRLLQLSDLHIASPLTDPVGSAEYLALLQAVVAHARQRWPVLDGVVLTGDLSQEGSAESYAALQTVLLPWAVPLYCVAGNHDLAAVMRQHLVSGLIQMPPRWVCTSWQSLFLDTTQPLQVQGYLGPNRLQALNAQLAATPPHLHTLIWMHHPPFSVGNVWMDALALTDATAFWTVVTQYPQVKAVLCGHVHQAFTGLYQGIRVFTAPSTNRQFKPGCEQFELDALGPGYRWLLLADDGTLSTGIERIEGLF